MEYALTLNYEIISIHEAHLYAKSDFIFKDFISQLMILKLQNSDIFPKSLTFFEKEVICEQLKLSCKAESLHPASILPNDFKKQFYKNLANSLYGKFQQRKDFTTTNYVHSQAQLESLFFSEAEIVSITNISEDICAIESKASVKNFDVVNREANCIIGGQLTSYGRRLIHQSIMTVDKNGGQIFLSDTDSIFFTLKKSQTIPLPISNAIGEFKHVYRNIKSFYTLGPKNYCVTYEKDNQIFSDTKVKGFSFNSVINENEIDSATYDFFLSQFLKNQVESKPIIQFRTKQCTLKNVSKEALVMQFRNNVSDRRIVLKNSMHYQTFPYGFSFVPSKQK